MSVTLQESETLQNLMRAFAGESQARNRYTFAAEQCRRQKLHVLEAVFTFTANQEKEHAEIFYGHMSGVSSVTIQAGFPVVSDNNALSMLRSAQRAETEEAEEIYPAFAARARQEGFAPVAAAFEQIAAIEKSHAARFARFAELLESGTLFTAPAPGTWLCLNCGHIHSGLSAPERCPVCGHDQGFFIPRALAPYTDQQ